MEEKILEYIIGYGLKNGILPTFREIMAGVGLKSTSSIQIYMERLSARGEIEISDRRYRVRRLEYVKRESD
jgi:repressor LexA